MEITGGTPFNGEQGTGNIDFQIYHSEDFNHIIQVTRIMKQL